MHRRNQASNGTHMVPGIAAAGAVLPPYVTQQPDNASIMVGGGQMASYPPLYVNPSAPPGYAYPTHHPGGGYSGASFMQTSYSQTIIPGNLNVSAHMTQGGKNVDSFGSGSNSGHAVTNNPVISANIAAKKSVPNVLSAGSSVTSKTEPEEDATSTSGKKKRRRNRRKKKHGAGDDSGALSDEPMELHRAHSSSNVSRTSTVENDVGLHFEDEEEFPNLLSAATSGLTGASIAKQQKSYSDILKSQAVSYWD